MVIPSWLKHLKVEDVRALEDKVASLEAKCDVEVVPVIVRASSHYPQTKITWALLITVIFLGLWDILDMEVFWDQGLKAAIFVALYLICVFVVGPWVSRWSWVQMLLTHRDVEFEQCLKRAEAEFHSGKISQTKRQNGILIYISMLEHRVIIKGDEAVYSKVNGEKWQEAVDAVLAGIRKKQMAQGIGDALNVMEGLLQEHFPVHSEKINEIPNTLLIKE